MHPRSTPADTDPAVYSVLVEQWRALGIGGRANLANRLCIDVEHLPRAGIIAQHPDFTEIEVDRELARRRYGDEITEIMYGTKPQHR